jgi:Family of unknown function (DUF6131)
VNLLVSRDGLLPADCGTTGAWMCLHRIRGDLRGMCSNLADVITLGIILLIVGLLIHSAILWVIGIFLLIIGAILALLGALGRAVFGRRHYW